MSTLKPEEVIAVWNRANGLVRRDEVTEARLQAFAAALEAELRKRWFSVVVRYDPLAGTPLYFAPQDQEPT